MIKKSTNLSKMIKQLMNPKGEICFTKEEIMDLPKWRQKMFMRCLRKYLPKHKNPTMDPTIELRKRLNKFRWLLVRIKFYIIFHVWGGKNIQVINFSGGGLYVVFHLKGEKKEE